MREWSGEGARDKACEYALDRMSLSLVLQACGRGIRSETDRCAFVLLDRRYHDCGWRWFLDPRPYNVQNPKRNVQAFHQEHALVLGPAWDSALLCFVGREVVG